MDRNEFRAEFRTRIVETWLLYAITYEMSIEKATIFLGKIESQALLDFPDWKRAGARRPVIEELLERLGEIETAYLRKKFPELPEPSAPQLPATNPEGTST